MRRLSLIFLLLAVWVGAAGAEYTCLHQVLVEFSGASVCFTDSVAVYFDMSWDDSTFIAVEHHPHWHDGDGLTGSVEYTTGNASTFTDIVTGLTNGVDEHVGFLTRVVSSEGYSEEVDFESQLGFGDPDLEGAEIHWIHAIVGALSVSRDGEWVSYEGAVVWEYWGEPDSPVQPAAWGRLKSLYR